MKNYKEKLSASYNIELPKRLCEFYDNEEYLKYPSLKFDGFIRGPYNLDFINETLLSITELGEEAGIDDLDDLDWEEDCSNLIPFATLSHPKLEFAKCFLVIKIDNDKLPIYLFDYEGWTFYPVAKSLDSFLKNLPEAKNSIEGSFSAGENSDEEE